MEDDEIGLFVYLAKILLCRGIKYFFGLRG